jgi:hypothetical protein
MLMHEQWPPGIVPAVSTAGSCQDSSLDPVKDGPHAAEGVVVGEVELRLRLVVLPDVWEAAVPLVLYLPLWRVLSSARYLPWEVLVKSRRKVKEKTPNF